MIGLELPRPHHLAYIWRNNATHTLSSMRPRCTALAILTCDRPARRGSMEESQTFHFMHHHCRAQAFDRTSPHFFHPRPSKFGQGQNVCNRRACRAWMGALNPFRNTHQERNYFSYLGRGQNTDPQSMDYLNGLPKWTTPESHLKGEKRLFEARHIIVLTIPYAFALETFHTCDPLVSLHNPNPNPNPNPSNSCFSPFK